MTVGFASMHADDIIVGKTLQIARFIRLPTRLIEFLPPLAAHLAAAAGILIAASSGGAYRSGILIGYEADPTRPRRWERCTIGDNHGRNQDAGLLRSASGVNCSLTSSGSRALGLMESRVNGGFTDVTNVSYKVFLSTLEAEHG